MELLHIDMFQAQHCAWACIGVITSVHCGFFVLVCRWSSSPFTPVYWCSIKVVCGQVVRSGRVHYCQQKVSSGTILYRNAFTQNRYTIQFNVCIFYRVRYSTWHSDACTTETYTYTYIYKYAMAVKNVWNLQFGQYPISYIR